MGIEFDISPCICYLSHIIPVISNATLKKADFSSSLKGTGHHGGEVIVVRLRGS